MGLARLAWKHGDDRGLICHALRGLRDPVSRPALTTLVAVHTKWGSFSEAAHEIMAVTCVGGASRINAIEQGEDVVVAAINMQQDGRSLNAPTGRPTSGLQCYFCHEYGHDQRNCPSRPAVTSGNCTWHGEKCRHDTNQCRTLKMVQRMMANGRAESMTDGVAQDEVGATKSDF
ncbi:Aste57867_23540 [Aphanomyces stellatus]|uniref:Aste57867_23540 protein n=1 Tax=Aphanomyces stellatus TaxID=120398 RepID=A0A485LMY8_9STRA|nr:hypothetical protein As57867_023469 [Aphanomyces stellatus]VFU00185.1 Aste57867_23540 [Aphanomyces stellatus]